jgi:hypothetical protein
MLTMISRAADLGNLLGSQFCPWSENEWEQHSEDCHSYRVTSQIQILIETIQESLFEAIFRDCQRPSNLINPYYKHREVVTLFVIFGFWSSYLKDVRVMDPDQKRQESQRETNEKKIFDRIPKL